MGKKTGTTHSEFKEKVLKDPQVKAEYDALEPKYRAEAERIRKKMAEGYQVTAKENKRFAEEVFPSCIEVVPPFDESQPKVKKRARSEK